MTTETAPQVYRLRDMQVQEVSLVDRPANKRKFILVKRDSKTMALGAELAANSDGSFSTAQKAPPPDPGAAPPGSEDTSAAPAPGADMPLSLTADMKTQLGDVMKSLTDALAAAQKMLDGAADAKDETEANPAPLADALANLCEMAEDAAMALLGIPDNDEVPPGGVPEPGAPAAQAGPGMDAQPLAARDLSVPFGKRLAVRKAHRVIAEVALTKKSRDLIEKVGRKMAKSRLERFKGALRMLADIFGELDGAAKAAPPPPPPAAEKDPKKKPAPGAPPPPAPPAAKAEQDPAVLALSKQLAEATAQVEALKKGLPPSNAIPVDGDPAPLSTEVRWSLDMGNSSRPKFDDDDK